MFDVTIPTSFPPCLLTIKKNGGLNPSAASYFTQPFVFTRRFKMSDLFSSYENTFGHLTAEITAKIGRIPNLEGGTARFNTITCVYKYVEIFSKEAFNSLCISGSFSFSSVSLYGCKRTFKGDML